MKNKILGIVIMFIAVTIIGTCVAPVVSYASSNKFSFGRFFTANTFNFNKASVNNTNVSTKENDSTTSKNSTKAVEVNNNSIINTYQSSAIVDEKKDVGPIENLKGVNATIESKVFKGFSEIENIEVGSTLIYSINLKNTSGIEKHIELTSNTISMITGSRAVASICNIDKNVGDSEAEEGLVAEKKLTFNGILNITLGANEEKVVRIEKYITKYNQNTVENVFTVTCGNSSLELKDSRHANTPARIDANIKLYVNSAEILSGRQVQLKSSDTAKYIIVINNNGETAENVDITNVLPRSMQVLKAEYQEKGKKVASSEEYKNNNTSLTNITIPGNSYVSVALTVKPTVNGNTTINNYAEIRGSYVGLIRTNTLTHTFIFNEAENEITANETFNKDFPKRGQSEDILGSFGDVSFLGYGLNNIGQKITIGFKSQFRPNKNMYCVSEGKSYYQYLKIEGFYVRYDSKNYKYNTNTNKLEEYNGTINIGNDQNFINEHYDELAYMLSVIEDYNSVDFYQSIGIGFAYNGDRPDHRLSPVQIAIWRLQGVSEQKMVTKMRNVLKEYGVTNQAEANQIINNILNSATKIYARANAYQKYVAANYIGTEPNVSFSNNETIQVNGKTLVGPFTITYPLTTATASYTNVITGNTVTKTGRYGEIRQIDLVNNGYTYSTVYDINGNQINLSNVTSNILECYFDITGTNYDFSQETTIKTKMNNQYRQAYFFTIASQYDDGQNIIVGRGTRSFKTYTKTFIVEKMSLSGIVWLDIQQGIKSGSRLPNLPDREIQPPNGVLDENEEGIAGIDVYLLDNVKHQIIATTKTNANGRYAFNDLLKSNYSILFGYEGMNYIVSEADDDTDVTRTKVSETVDGSDLRSDYNDKFIIITNNKVINKKYSITENGEVLEQNDNYVMQYNLQDSPNGNKVSKLITMVNNEVVPVYKMYSKSINTYSETTDNINMGLKARSGDLSLYTYLDEISEQTKTVSMTAATKSQDTYITYAVQLNNQDSEISLVNKISYYYNTKFEFESAECRYIRNGNEIVNTNLQIENDDDTIISGQNYKKLNVRLPSSAYVAEGGRTTVYLKFRLTGEETLTAEDIVAYGEITSYTINGGIVDADSAPGNGIQQNGTILREDDFGAIGAEEFGSYSAKSAKSKTN